MVKKTKPAFERVLASLNISQKKAVETIEGPVMVIAGPGTGKTHILAARIGKILMETDAQPENILCLTFTESGVWAMRKRLVEFIGIPGHKVAIHTFHSFCNMVIQQYPEKFGHHNMQVISDLDRIDLIRRVLDQLPADSLLISKAGGRYAKERNVRSLFNTMKFENWTYAKIEKAVSDYLGNLHEKEGFYYKRSNSKRGIKIGDPHTINIEKEKKKMEATLEAAKCFEVYESYLQKEGWYEYGDMINWVLKAFQEDDSILAEYRERYLYFLVDEFQDTNGSQSQILQLLADFWEAPNLFIVGDDDQAIYEFQGARLENLKNIYQKYGNDMELVVLEDNYRSTQEILDAASYSIENNELRAINKLGNATLTKKLIAKNRSIADLKEGIKVIQYENDLQEMMGVKEEIIRLHQNGTAYSEMAVIFYLNKDGEELASYLQQFGIPVQLRKQVDILRLPLFKQIYNLLNYLDQEAHVPFSGEHLLFPILHYDCMEVGASTLARMAMYRRNMEGKKCYWRELMMDESNLEPADLREEEKERVWNAGKFLEKWINQVHQMSVLELVGSLVWESGLMEQILKGDSKEVDLQMIKSFLVFIEDEIKRDPTLNLSNLLGKLYRMMEHYISIPIFIGTGNKNAVHLITAHSSKGLEFENVWMVKLTKDNWENKKGNSNAFALPDTLTLSGVEDHLEAKRRLFYVAMTRAKKQLHLSFGLENNGKQMTHSQFIDEVITNTQHPIQAKAFEDAAISEAILDTIKTYGIRQALENESDQLEAFFEHWALSASSFNEYLRCPISFYFNQVLGVPRPSNDHLTYGMVIHRALERYFRWVANDSTKFDNSKPLMEYFEEEMNRRRGFFTPQMMDIFEHLGKSTLEEYHKKSANKWLSNYHVEYEVKRTVFEGVPLTGKIDKCEYLSDGSMRVIDYKTSKPDNNRLKEIVPEGPHKGTYRIQLYFYKVLLESFLSKGSLVKFGEIDYTGHQKEEKTASHLVEFDHEELEVFQRLLVDTYKKIRNLEFDEGCGDVKCNWCSFVKSKGILF